MLPNSKANEETKEKEKKEYRIYLSSSRSYFKEKRREEEEGKGFVNCSSTIAGETDAIEFSGSANDGSDGAGSRCGSLLGPSLVGGILNFPLSADTSSHSIARDLRNLFCSPLRCT